jgi:hypothetical protein
MIHNGHLQDHFNGHLQDHFNGHLQDHFNGHLQDHFNGATAVQNIGRCIWGILKSPLV